jgi:hypothetical protein
VASKFLPNAKARKEKSVFEVILNRIERPDEPYVSIHLMGANAYATAKQA